MKYFDALPLVSVTDKFGNTQVYKNLMTRVSVMPDILNNTLVYYSYDIQEGDTPEIVAHKYYGDSYRYWIVMLSNKSLDPQWDWPLNSVSFQKYITEKYDVLGFDPYTTTRTHQKIITQNNSQYGQIVDTVSISEDEYDALTPTNSTLSFTQETVEVSITKNIQTYYQYELALNESKRNIKLLNKIYVPQIESEFQKLLSNT